MIADVVVNSCRAVALELAEQGDAAGPGGVRSLPALLIGFGLVLLLITMSRMLRKSFRDRRRRPNETAAETIQRHRSEAVAAREPLTTMMAEADELARRLAKLLDSKATRLELLIEEADQRLAALGQAAARPIAPAPTAAPATSLEDSVLELSGEGCDSAAIARQLGCTVSEVDLILALHPASDRDQTTD